AKGEVVVADSSIEHLIWEDLFGMPAISTVKALQLTAQANVVANTPMDLIQGDQLNDANAPAIFARLKPGMQTYISFLQQFVPEAPYLYSLTDTTSLTSGTNGTAFLIFPSTAAGKAAAYLAQSPAQVLLGGSDVRVNQ